MSSTERQYYPIDKLSKEDKEWKAFLGVPRDFKNAIAFDLVEAVPVFGNILRASVSLHTALLTEDKEAQEEERRLPKLMMGVLPSFIPVRTIWYLKQRKKSTKGD